MPRGCVYTIVPCDCCVFINLIDFDSAAAKGNLQRLRSYAAAGADPSSANDMYGRTPLHAVRILLLSSAVNY